MKIFLNSKEFEAKNGTNLADFIATVSDSKRGFALALNNSVIKKENWETTFLAENDQILLIKAAYGG